MRNLAGHPEATGFFREELAACHIKAVPSARLDGETKCSVDGLAVLPGGFRLRVVRGWVYCRVTIEPALPVAVATRVNQRRRKLPEMCSYYSGRRGRLGDVARAHGFAGGMSRRMLRKWGACDHWHVDSAEALDALRRVLGEELALAGTTAEEAAREYVRWKTEEWLRECAPHLDSDNGVGRIMREDLHANPLLDGGDVRIASLRKRYPKEARDE